METDEKPRGKEATALSGGHLCHVCGYQYPNPNPSAKLRRSHRKHCGKAVPAPAAVEEEGGPVGPPLSDREEGNAGERTLQGVKGGEVDEKREDNGGAPLLGSAREVGESVEVEVVAEHAYLNGNGVHHATPEINETGQLNCMNTENATPDDKAVNSELSKNGLDNCSSNSEHGNEGNGSQLSVACNNGSQNEVAKHRSELAPATVTNPAEREDSFDEYQDASPFLPQSDSEDGALPSSEFPIEINNLNIALSRSSAANEISLETNGLCNDQGSGELNSNDLSAGSKVGNDSENGSLSMDGSASLKLEVPYESYKNVGNNHTDMVDSERPDKRFYFESICDTDASSLQEAHSVDLNVDSQSTCFRKVQGENCPVKDTADVQLPVENLCQKNLCSTEGFQNNLPPTSYVDDTLNITKDSCSDMDFTFEKMTQQDVVEQVNVTEENPSVQKTNGFTEDAVCNKQIDHEVHTEDQFLKSQKHAMLPTDQTSCAKNPSDVDDDRNDDLFELSTDSCYLEVPSVVSRQEVDSASLMLDQPTVSNQNRIAEAQYSCNSNDPLSFSENSHPIGPKDMPNSSSAELVMNTRLADVPLDHDLQEDEAHTNGILFAPYQIAPVEFCTVGAQDSSVLGTDAEENSHTEGVAAMEMTVVRTTDGIEMKHAGDTTAVDTYGINVEAKKVTDDTAAEMNGVQHCSAEEKHTDSTKEVSALSMDPNTKEMNAQVDADDLEGKWQVDDNFEKMCAQATRVKEVIALQCTEKVDENKQTNPVVGQEGDNKKEEIAVTGGRLNSGRIRVPLKVLLAEASAENKVNKPSAKERVLSLGRRSSKNDNLSAKTVSPKSGSDDRRWESPAKLPRKDTDKSSKGKKQPWMPFICCHSVR